MATLDRYPLAQRRKKKRGQVDVTWLLYKRLTVENQPVSFVVSNWRSQTTQRYRLNVPFGSLTNLEKRGTSHGKTKVSVE